MARTTQYPNFEKWLSTTLAFSEAIVEGKTYSNKQLKEIIQKCKKSDKTTSFHDGAFEAFEKNTQRFWFKLPFLHGNGAPHSGYTIGDEIQEFRIPEDIAEDVDEKRPTDNTENRSKMLYGQTKESILHVPAQLMLTREKQALVYSMPSKVRNHQWANPDMLYVRETISGVEASLRELLDSRAPLTVGACELKFFQLTASGKISDTEFYKAIAEARASGRWANETCLVFLREKRFGFGEKIPKLGSRLLNFAQTSEVGVVELVLRREGPMKCARILDHEQPK